VVKKACKSYIINGMIAAACMFVSLHHAASQQSLPPHTEAFVDFAKNHAADLVTVEPGSGFDDLTPLKKAIGDTRIVCLGESRHDIHEHFRLKHRIFEFLVKEMGFTVFAMEEGLPNGDAINRYILGGDGDPAQLLNSMCNWYIWDTQEVQALIKWMREYNMNPRTTSKIEFYGVDMMDPLSGIMNALDYLDKVDPESASKLRNMLAGLQIFEADIWSEILARYVGLSKKEADNLKSFIASLSSVFTQNRSAYIEGSSEHEYEWMLRQVQTVRQAHDAYSLVTGSSIEEKYKEIGESRDRAMADNALWLMKYKGEKSRICLWAHNFHVARFPIDLNTPPQPPTEGLEPLAWHLGSALGSKLYTIGFSFYEAHYRNQQVPTAEPDMIDAALNKVGPPVFFLDLRTAPERGPVYDWLHSKQRIQGEQGGTATVYPGKTFDGFLFVRSVTRTVMNPHAIRRLMNLR